MIEDSRSSLPHSEPAGPTNGLPGELVALLNPNGSEQGDEPWTDFVRRYSRLLLHTVHSRSNGYDDAMDRYTFVLESLREDDYRRLRKYDPDSRARFTTWLVVVAGRLCIDFHRKRYGVGAGERDGREDHETRRRLVDLISSRVDLAQLADMDGSRPDIPLRQKELLATLDRAVGELDGRDRWLLRLRFLEELPAREIASLMDFPTLFHVYRRVNRVLGRLRASLEARGFDDPRP